MKTITIVLQILTLVVCATNSGIAQKKEPIMEKISKIELSQSKVDSILSKYESAKFNKYDNLMYAYQELLMQPIFDQAGNFLNQYEFIKALNPDQKTLFWLLTFDGQVLNGGLTQFFWNYGENSNEIIEHLKKIGNKELLKQYKSAYKEFQKVRVPFLLPRFDGDPDGFIKAKKLFNGEKFDTYYYSKYI